MSTRIRFSRKRLKEPDEFLTLTDKIVHYCVENRTIVSGIAVGILILLGAGAGIRFNQQVADTRMESLLVEMEQIRNQDKDKQSSQVMANLEAALGKFGEGSHKRRARLLLADVYYQSKQFDKAIELYSDVAGKASAGEMSRDLARLGLAYSYEAKREYKKAIGIYREIIDHKSVSLPIFPVYLDLVRCYELDTDRKNALLVLREIKNKFQNTADMEKIDRQIGRLEAAS